ncbi:MAG TPA: lysophospholipid acyltransferase family protein [Rectinemataceae bacterium]|nr:lysophospholipid acyltransferase family protein [Rectinemataceae bacterium]
MLNAIIIAVIVFVFIYYDALIRFNRVFRRKRALEITEVYGARTVERIFRLFQVYAGFRIEFEDRSGTPLPERFLLVANHQSLLDIPITMGLLRSRRLRFVAKRELGKGIPLVSVLLNTVGHALINRKGDAMRAMTTIDGFAKRCRRDGTCPVIFPEGTRSRTGEVGPFHTAGVRRLFEEESLPVVVAAIEGGWRVAKFRDLIANLSGGSYCLRLIAVLPPPKGKKETLEAVQKARELCVAAIRDMRGAGCAEVIVSE